MMGMIRDRSYDDTHVSETSGYHILQFHRFYTPNHSFRQLRHCRTHVVLISNMRPFLLLAVCLSLALGKYSYTDSCYRFEKQKTAP